MLEATQGRRVYDNDSNTVTTPKRIHDERRGSRSVTPSFSPAVAALSRQEPPKGRTLSCSECKRRKIKCDRECPCGPCILRNDQARCKPVIRWEAGCSLSEFTVLQNRVADLEDRLDTMQNVLLEQSSGGTASTSALNHLLPQQSQQQSRPAKRINAASKSENHGSHAANSSATATSNEAANSGRDGEDDAVMMLEDFAMGNRANARRAAQKLVPRPGALERTFSAESPDVLRFETAASQRSGDLAIDVAYRFLRFSPPPETVRVIANYYFDRLEWHTKCLHRPSYMEDLEVLLSLDTETAAQSVRPTFLCVHFMVICLSVHLCSGEEAQQWGYEREPAIHLCDAFFAGAQQLLWASDFIGSHQTEHLQAVVLMSVYAYNVDEQADAAYALVGASIKIAQNLALNRLDDPRFLENERQKNKAGVAGSASMAGLGSSPLQPQAPLERELGKRIWWYLVWLDWSHALSHGGCYAIHPAHNKTNLPANVYDEDLVRDGPVASRPLTEYTPMSFTIWRLRFLMLYRETIDLHNAPGGMTYAQLLEMDRKLTDLLNGLPAYFQAPVEDSSTWQYGDSCHDLELLSIQITGYNRLLRLHRPFLARGLMDKNNISRKRCVDCAYKILAFMRHAKNHAPLLLKVWINIYYAFAGALVLFLDLCYDEGGDSQAAKKKRLAIREMLEICDTARHLSAAAKNTYSLLQGLLQAETDLRVHQNQESKSTAAPKRKRGAKGEGVAAAASASPFASLVERVLVDATSKNASGDSTASSLGRSPSEHGGGGGVFEPPKKRHSTSFVRDRAYSYASAASQYDGTSNTRYGRSSPLAGSGGGGAGHGGYFQNNEIASTPYSYSAQNNGTGGLSSIHQTPTSPWGVSSLRGTASQGDGKSGGNGAWGSGNGGPSTGAQGGTGTAGLHSPSGSLMGVLNSPVGLHGDHGSMSGRTTGGSGSHTGGPTASGGVYSPHTQLTGGHGLMTSSTSMAPPTTSSFTNLLDENIFSNLLMSGPMQSNSDWASALAAFVEPNPPSTPQQ